MNAVRYLAIIAMLAINILLLGLNLQKHELFPFTTDIAGELGRSISAGPGQ